MSDVLVGQAFDAALEEAKTIARKHAYDSMRLFSTTHEGNVTKISIFGGEWVWVIDRDQKRIYEVSQIHSKVVSFGAPTQTIREMPSSLHVRESAEGVQLLVSAAVGGNMQERWKAHVFSSFHSIMEAHMVKAGMLQERHCNTEALEAMRLLNGEVTRKVLQYQQKKLNKAVMTVVNTCWGKGIHWPKACRVIGKEVWKHLDQEIAKLTLMATGRYANGFDYNLIWKYKDEAMKVASHSPALIPIWMEICKRPPKKATQEVELDWADELAKPKPEPKEMSFNMGNIVESVQAALNYSNRPLTKSAWRYLLKLKPLWVECLVRTKMQPGNHHSLGYEGLRGTTSPIYSFTDYINLCGEVGELPSYTFFLQAARHIHGAGYSPSFVSFMRAAFKASKKKPRKTFMETQFSLAYDWWKAGNHNRGRLLDKNQMRAEWSWFMRQQNEWHTAVLLDEKLKHSNETWFNLVPETEVNTKEGVLCLVPLNNTYELFDEGKAMHHCVNSYSYVCENGSSRIYSIRKDDVILATVELKKRYADFKHMVNELHGDYQEDDGPIRKELASGTLEDVQWTIAQTRGPCNKEVSEGVKAAATRLRDEYNKAWQTATDEERAKHRSKPGEQKFNWNAVAPVEIDQIQPMRAAPVHDEIDWAF